MAAAEFDRLRKNKKLKKIGRCDLLIAVLTLANRANRIENSASVLGCSSRE
jgi:hypothetical protein